METEAAIPWNSLAKLSTLVQTVMLLRVKKGSINNYLRTTGINVSVLGEPRHAVILYLVKQNTLL